MNRILPFLLLPVLSVAQTRVDVAPVWAGHPVGFDLLTHGDRQFVAFYDAERNMTVAARTLGSDKFIICVYRFAFICAYPWPKR
jgi:hypothetical protein